MSTAPQPPKRRNCVIVRAGNGSLHPRWLEVKDRNWDLIVNYYGDDPDIFRGGDWERIDGKGPKMPGLYEVLKSQRAKVEHYDYVLLPDDDLECTGDDINRIFDICREYQLELAQPSLTHSSYFVHPVTLHNRYFRLRYTTFVEIMAPCLSQEALWQVWPSFKRNLSGWGLCYFWPQRLIKRRDHVAIIDAVQVRHTRPASTKNANYAALRASGRSAVEELEELFAQEGLTRDYGIRRALTRSGEVLTKGSKLNAMYALGLLGPAPPKGRLTLAEFVRMWLSGVYHQVRSEAKPV